MLVEKLMIAGRDRAEAERKVCQIYRHCEILECQEVQPASDEDIADFASVIDLISRSERA